MTQPRKQQVGLADSPDNPMTARVDDVVLTRGGEPKELTADQLARLQATGVALVGPRGADLSAADADGDPSDPENEEN